MFKETDDIVDVEATESQDNLPQINILGRGPVLAVMALDAIAFALIFPFAGTLFAGGSFFMHLSLALGLCLFPLAMIYGFSFFNRLAARSGQKQALSFSMFGMLVGFLIQGAGAALPVAWAGIALFLFGRLFTGFMAGNLALAQTCVGPLGSRPFQLLAIFSGMFLGALMGGFYFQSVIGHILPFVLAALCALAVHIQMHRGWIEPSLIVEEKPLLEQPLLSLLNLGRADKNPLLLGSFLLLQLAVAFYVPYVSFGLHNKGFGYPSWVVGLFDAFIAACFILSMFLPCTAWMSKRFSSIGAIIVSSMLLASLLAAAAMIMGGAQYSHMLWILAPLIIIFAMVANRLLLPMISGPFALLPSGLMSSPMLSLIAFAWSLSGLFALTISSHGYGLILLGAFCALASCIMMMIAYLRGVLLAGSKPGLKM